MADTIALDKAAKQKGYTPAGLVKKLITNKSTNKIHIDSDALDALPSAGAGRGRGVLKTSAAYRAFAAAMAGLPESEIEKRYTDYRAALPKPAKRGGK